MTTQHTDRARLIPLAWQGEKLIPTQELSPVVLDEKKPEVTLIYTTDFHSSILGGMGLPANVGGIAKIATTIRQAREAGPTLVLDDGDEVFGIGTWWDANGASTTARLRGAAGCDLASIGNHDVEHGLESLGELFEGGYPFVAANITFDDARFSERVRPAYIAELAGWRIGVTGATTPEAAHLIPARRRAGWSLHDPLESLQAVIRELGPQVDTIVILSHLGYYVGPDELGDQSLAPQLSGNKVSVILGGHTHGALIPAPTINGIVVCNAGGFGEYVGEVKLAETLEGRNVEVRARLLRQDEAVKEDAEMVALRDSVAEQFTSLRMTQFALPQVPDLGEDGLTAGFGGWTLNRDRESVLLAQALHASQQFDPQALAFVPLLYVIGELPKEAEVNQASLFQTYSNSEYIVELEIAGRDLKKLMASQTTMIFFQQALPLWLRDQSRVKEAQLEDEVVYKVVSIESFKDGSLGWTDAPALIKSARVHELNGYELVLQYLRNL